MRDTKRVVQAVLAPSLVTILLTACGGHAAMGTTGEVRLNGIGVLIGVVVFVLVLMKAYNSTHPNAGIDEPKHLGCGLGCPVMVALMALTGALLLI